MAKSNISKMIDSEEESTPTMVQSVNVLEAANNVEEEIAVKIQAEKQPEDIEDLLDSEISIDPSQRYVFELLATNITKYIYPTEQTIFDPIQRRQREIKYVRSSQSVFKEFQGDVVLNDTYTPIVFECPKHLLKKGAKAKIEVLGTDKNLIKYLLLSTEIEGSRTRINNNGKPLFRLIDKAKIAREKLASMELRFEAIELARKMSIEKLRPIAYVLGVNSQDDANLKADLYVKIEANPGGFMQLASDPSTSRKYFIKKALDSQVITTALHANQLYWVETNAKITNLDPTQDSVDYITAWSMSTDEGQEFFNLLRRKIS